MALIGACGGWDQETELVARWRAYRHLVPHHLARSRVNRRRRALWLGCNALRQVVVRLLDVAQQRPCAIDSLPAPVVQVHLVPGAGREWAAHEAALGVVSSKQQWIYGDKLPRLVTLGGVILDFVLAPANAPAAQVGYEVLADHTDLVVGGDKGDLHAALAAQLQAECHGTLLTLRRVNQRQQLPPAVTRLLSQSRQIIEPVNSQVAAPFHMSATRICS